MVRHPRSSRLCSRCGDVPKRGQCFTGEMVNGVCLWCHSCFSGECEKVGAITSGSTLVCEVSSVQCIRGWRFKL